MGAFILGCIIFGGALGTCAPVIAGDKMSDSRSTDASRAPIVFAATAIAGLVLASRWMPAIGR
jgi:hypothetical protein